MAKVLPAPLIGGLLLLGLGGLLLLGGGPGFPGLDRTVIGIEALSGVLERAGVAVSRSDPRISPRLQDLGLRILPLYDMDLATESTGTRSADSSSLRDLDADVFARKVADLPTLVVLPKWRAAAAGEGVAAPKTLIPVALYRSLLNQIGLTSVTLHRAKAEFQMQPWQVGGTIALFAPQTFDPATFLATACRPRVLFGDNVLVAACAGSDNAPDLWILSDPDLMNNHGLTLGQNAAAAVKLIKLLQADTRPVYLDTSVEILTTNDQTAREKRPYTRSGTDLARFFAPPFTLLWPMGIILLALLCWRGALRFGPVRPEDPGGIHHAKSAAIATRARLIRLAGHDAQMVADFVQSDLQRVAGATFGPGRGEPARLFALLARRDPAQTASLRAVTEALTHPRTTLGPAELTRLLSTYRILLESLTHGPVADRVSNPR